MVQSTQFQGRMTSTPIKPKSKANQSILSFFKKEVSPQKSLALSTHTEEDALFFDIGSTVTQKEKDADTERVPEPSQIPTPPSDHSHHWSDGPSEQISDTARYNEVTAPVKRRRVGATPIGFLRPKAPAAENAGELMETGVIKLGAVEGVQKDLEDEKSNRALVPRTSDDCPEGFLEYINTCKDENGPSILVKQESAKDSILETFHSTSCQSQDILAVANIPPPEPPPLKREPTSYIDVDEFERLDDFIDDEFPEEGEEYQERQWMDEQFLKEQDMEVDQEADPHEPDELENGNSNESCCPICNVSLVGIIDAVCQNFLRPIKLYI